jgi:4-carboxymuconolactone decarboxylase
MDDKGRFEGGMKIKRGLRGPDYVDRGMAASGELISAMQDVITHDCWGDIWSRRDGRAKGGAKRRD